MTDGRPVWPWIVAALVGLGLLLCCGGCGVLVPLAPEPAPTQPAVQAPDEPVTSPPARTPEPMSPAPPPSDLPAITQAGGLGDSAARFHALHRPTSGSGAMPPSFAPDGTMLMGMYDDNYYVVSAAAGVVQAVTLQLEARTMLSRRAAWDEATRHVPSDRRKVRSFDDTIGGEVTVFHSESLARHLPDEVWYHCQPVGTFQVVLQRLGPDPVYFGVLISAGVDYDDNDPGRRDDCRQGFAEWTIG